MGDEGGQEVAPLGAAGVLGALEQPAGDHGLDLGQAGVLADRQRARPAQLHAVVLGRVVAGGEHRGRRVERAGGEVAEVGGGQPEVDDVGAGDQRALGEGGDQRLGRRAGVAADEHAGRPGERHEGVADAAGDRFVELVGIDPANVIGLEDGVERRVGHRSLGSSPPGAGRKSYPPPTPLHTGIVRAPARRSPHHTRPPRPSSPTTVSTRPDLVGRGGGERQPHVVAGGHDHHEVGRGPPRPVGALGLPVGVVGGLHHHRDPGARHVERRSTTRWCGCSRPSTSGSGRLATERAPRAVGARPRTAGPPSVSGRSSAAGSLNHGTAVHSHGLNSAVGRGVRRPAPAAPSHCHDGADCRSSTTTGW